MIETQQRDMFFLLPKYIYYITGFFNVLKKNERNILFNDALNTFYLRLYGIGYMIKDCSDNERENLQPLRYGATLCN